jgi:hypothetical protein
VRGGLLFVAFDKHLTVVLGGFGDMYADWSPAIAEAAQIVVVLSDEDGDFWSSVVVDVVGMCAWRVAYISC